MKKLFPIPESIDEAAYITMTVTPYIEQLLKEEPFDLEIELLGGERKVLSNGRIFYRIKVEDQNKCMIFKGICFEDDFKITLAKSVMTFTFTQNRRQAAAFTGYLQHLMEHSDDELQREVLYRLVTRLYKRLLDEDVRTFRITLSRTESIAFRDCYYNDVSGMPDAYTFAIVQPLFQRIDRATTTTAGLNAIKRGVRVHALWMWWLMALPGDAPPLLCWVIALCFVLIVVFSWRYATVNHFFKKRRAK